MEDQIEELIEQRNALMDALQHLLYGAVFFADFKNGVTDSTGSIDEGEVVAADVFEKARAAIRMAGGTPEASN